ncbi:MAG: Lrp/AsnC family transcriptional regulator [Amylibacter sp.]|nr:Lrp/AsnC family transcriptional regulator [Amylibacter sp.]
MENTKEKPLDPIDLKILRALVANAKISTADLAQSVGLSTSPCWQRIRRLEADGYITGYAAKLDQYKLGATDIVFVEVSLERHNQDALNNFGRIIKELDEVLEVFLTSGEHDYLLKVAITGTRGYENFLTNTLSRIPGIRQTRSSFALRCLKDKDVFIP